LSHLMQPIHKMVGSVFETTPFENAIFYVF